MAEWRLLAEATERERARFADRDAALRFARGPAGPRNRLRSVLRLADGEDGGDGGTWFLKTFTRTQWKNRLRNALTRPRARDDAEREWRMTAALRDAGIEAPRPVAVGRDGASSFYLCARLPGRPLAELLAVGELAPRAARAAASFCGELLRSGFLLPDLSADHVFVLPAGAGGTPRFGVLDVTNGTLRAPGPPPRRACVRVLRRFARSVRGLPVPWPAALRFAVRLLRAAGRGGATRAVLRALPPFQPAARYERPGKSAAYAGRAPGRARREAELLRRVWPGRPGESVLDAPCGAGRLLSLLRSELGCRVVWADAAAAMLREARARHAEPPPAVRADALALPFADGAVDGAVAFRFLHHLPRALAARAVAETCRTARRFVVFSFFHPCSAHHARRTLAALLLRRAPTRHAMTLGALRELCRAHGYRLHAAAAQLPFARDLWVASFVRDERRRGVDQSSA